MKNTLMMNWKFTNRITLNKLKIKLQESYKYLLNDINNIIKENEMKIDSNEANPSEPSIKLYKLINQLIKIIPKNLKYIYLVIYYY